MSDIRAPEVVPHRRFYGAFFVDALAGIGYSGGNKEVV